MENRLNPSLNQVFHALQSHSDQSFRRKRRPIGHLDPPYLATIFPATGAVVPLDDYGEWLRPASRESFIDIVSPTDSGGVHSYVPGPTKKERNRYSCGVEVVRFSSRGAHLNLGESHCCRKVTPQFSFNEWGSLGQVSAGTRPPPLLCPPSDVCVGYPK